MHAWRSDRGGRESQRHELAVDERNRLETGRSTRASRDSRTTATRSFFQTAEQMSPADTDSSVDIYERAGSTTTLISTGPAGGNGAFDADFYEASKDGSRAVFETNESLVSADTDTTKDVYERVGSTTNLVSTGPTSGSTPIDSFFLGTSQDGLHIFFMAYEPLVAADDDNGRRDIYERFNGQTNLISTGPASTNELVEAIWGGNTPDGATRLLHHRGEPRRAATPIRPGTCTSAPARPPSTYRRARTAATERSMPSSMPRRSTARGSSSPPRSRW